MQNKHYMFYFHGIKAIDALAQRNVSGPVLERRRAALLVLMDSKQTAETIIQTL